MKKNYLVLLLFSVVFLSNAQQKGEGSSKLTKNGFYVESVLGMATTDNTTAALGGGVKLGNVWYFGTNEVWKPGVKTVWFRGTTYFGDSDVIVQGSVANVGFANILKFNENVGLELNFNVGYNVVYNSYDDEYYNGYYYTSTDDFIGGGIMFNPEIKFRYKVLAVGLDMVFSNITDFSEDEYYNGSYTTYYSTKTPFNSINLSIGAKF